MVAKWIETLTGSLEQKKQYKRDKARIEALPEPYGSTGKAFERYFMYYGGVTDGDTLVRRSSDGLRATPMRGCEVMAASMTMSFSMRSGNVAAM